MEGVEGHGLGHLEAIAGPESLTGTADRTGVLFAPGLLDPEPLHRLRRQVITFGRAVGWLAPDAAADEARCLPGVRVGSYRDPRWIRLQVEFLGAPLFREIGRSAAILNLLRTALPHRKDPELSTANTVRAFSADPELTTRPHQDGPDVPRLGEFWTAWIPLGDCPLSLGPLAVLPGSHHDGPRPHSDGEVLPHRETASDDADWRTADFECGDVILFHCHTLHRAIPNRSDMELRLSIDFRYSFGASGGSAAASSGTWARTMGTSRASPA